MTDFFKAIQDEIDGAPEPENLWKGKRSMKPAVAELSSPCSEPPALQGAEATDKAGPQQGLLFT